MGGVSSIAYRCGESQDKWEAAIAASYVPWLMPTLTYFDTRIANDKVPASYVAGMGSYVAQWREADTHRVGFELIAKSTVVGVGLPGKLTYSAGWTHLTTLDGTPRRRTRRKFAAIQSTAVSWWRRLYIL